MKKAIVLLSGGLDSATTLAMAQDQGFNCYAISFQYGQRHDIEITASKKVAKAFNVEHHIVIDINLNTIGGSALTTDIKVPKHKDVSAVKENIPITYVPARNTIFLSFALGWADALGIHDIFIGVNALDYSGYPDCRPEYIDAYEKMANLATREGVEGRKITIHAPLMEMNKAEVITAGTALGVDYGLTHTCYDPVGEKSCGHCDSCLLRLKGFKEAGLVDPIPYVE